MHTDGLCLYNYLYNFQDKETSHMWPPWIKDFQGFSFSTRLGKAELLALELSVLSSYSITYNEYFVAKNSTFFQDNSINLDTHNNRKNIVLKTYFATIPGVAK